MRIASVVGLVAVVSWWSIGEANAQPGLASPAPCDAYTEPCGQPVQVTPDEYRLLQRGYISDGQHVGGGLVGTFFGFGLGHAVQGRWSEKGWMFTVGESAGIGLVMYGLIDCIEDDYYDEYGDDDCAWGSIAIGMVALSVFRIWELVDVWAGPAQHNARVRNLRYRLGLEAPPRTPAWGVFAAPPRDGEGAVAGITLRF